MNKRWVIGDIHGCYKTLKSLIEEQVKPTKEDQLYFVGDYIDRGPDSKGVIDYILTCKERGYNLTCLKGNHEDMMLKYLITKDVDAKKQWLANGGANTIKSFNKKIPKRYITFLLSLKYYIELEDCFIVHAGFNFKKKDFLSAYNEMLWIRNWENDITKTKGKKIICGHTPTSINEIKNSINLKNNKIIIDNGCVFRGKLKGIGGLCALELNDMSLFYVSCIDY